MTTTTHMVIRASAGSGKTYTLSNRYLRLLREGAPPDTILATTFTRKAAGEILGRVLTRLAQAATSEAAAREFGKTIKEPTLPLGATRTMLTTLCTSLHRVAVSTIDSFFNRMAQGFRHELGIPPGARIVGPDDPVVYQLRRQAIDALLADDRPEVLIDLLRRLHHDTAQRSITEAIDGIVSKLYEVYRQSEPECWTRLEVPDTVLDAPGLAEALAALQKVASENGQKALAKGLEPNLRAALANDWEKFLAQGLSPKIEADPCVYNRVPIPPAICEAYGPLLGHARGELIARVARQNEATLDLLRRFDKHYRELRLQAKVLLFSDLPHKLARELPGLGDGGLLTDVYYRLDTRVGHLLLDEFQDTSVEQWGVLKPFADEITSYADGSRTFFCVGDVKQAIYGWRGGCAELFDEIEETLSLPGAGARQQLNKSYRSSPVVLDAVNQVFSSIAENPALANMPAVAEAWGGCFQSHTANSAKQPGFVELITSPAVDAASVDNDGGDDEAEGDVAQSAHDLYAAWKIAEISRAIPGKSIGVLVGTNEMVRRMIYLLQNQGVQASGEGGNPVTDDAAVGAVLSALTLADHPGDTAAAYHVVNSPVGAMVGFEERRTKNEECNQADGANVALRSSFFVLPSASEIARVGLNIRRSLLTRGYAATIAEWVRKLAPSCTARSVERLMQLVELADRYDPAVTLRVSDFVRYVEMTPVEQPSPAAIRVMTVYKAKGLEFDAVVLPQLDRVLLGNHDLPVYVYRERPTGPVGAIYRATNQAVRDRCPEIAAAYEQERARRLRDDLCTLYVAMTRAKHALHMIVQPLKPRKDGGPSVKGLSNLCFASILRNALREGQEGFGGEQVLFEVGEREWWGGAQERKRETASEAAGTLAVSQHSANLCAPSPGSKTRHPLPGAKTLGEGLARSVPVLAPSRAASFERTTTAELMTLKDPRAQRRGRVLHAFLEQVGFSDDAEPDEATLLAAARRVEPAADDELLRAALGDFRRLLNHQAIRAALARPHPPGTPGSDAELWRERPFAVPVDGKLIRGTFDRVVIAPDQVTLIDFKTDTLPSGGGSGGPTALADLYRAQLDAYRVALARLLKLEPSAIRVRLVATAGPAVIDL